MHLAKIHIHTDIYIHAHDSTYWFVLMIILIVISSLHGMKFRPNTRNSMISRNFICQQNNATHHGFPTAQHCSANKHHSFYKP